MTGAAPLARLRSALKDLYRYRSVRLLVRRYGPSRWRLPRSLWWRIELQSAVLRRHRGDAVVHGARERVTPPALDDPPSFGHRISSAPYRTPPRFVVALPDVWLVGRWATPVTRDGRVLLTPFRDELRIMALEDHDDLVDFVARRSFADRPRGADAFPPPGATVFSMVNRLESNYGHWLLEICAQLEGVERLVPPASRDALRILVSKEAPAFCRASLDLLGYGDTLVDWEPDHPPQAVPRLLVASNPGSGMGYSPASLAWTRRRFLDALGPISETEREGPVRIYISRRPGGWRYVENHEEVERTLAAAGFLILRAEELSFREQVALFARAELVVSQHGSGLTNLLFAGPGCRTIELTGGYTDGAFFSLVTNLGQTYEHLDCRPVGDAIHVDVDQLLAAIDG